MEQNVLNFYKYQGTGNDFVMIDNRKKVFSGEDLPMIMRLCDRKFGIGADGLILINTHPIYDFEMIYYNADSTQSMCGNGSRCAVHLARHLGMIDETTTFLAADGEHNAFIKNNRIHVKMVDVHNIEHLNDGYFLNTGTRHYVSIVENLSEFDVFNKGKAIRYDNRFMPEGTNANFIELGANQVFMRIYERGVENETLSSGTGVTAVALVAASVYHYTSPVTVKTLGGALSVTFEQKNAQEFKNIYMTGPAEMVFEGSIFI